MRAESGFLDPARAQVSKHLRFPNIQHRLRETLQRRRNQCLLSNLLHSFTCVSIYVYINVKSRMLYGYVAF